MSEATAVQAMNGQMVQISVPHWFAEPDFQEWFNNHLGCGLATWRNANAPLEPAQMYSSDCLSHAKKLEAALRVLREDDPEFASELPNLHRINLALDMAVGHLTGASMSGGIAPEAASSLLDALREAVLDVAVDSMPAAFLEPVQDVCAALDRFIDEMTASDLFTFADCFVGVEPYSEAGEGTDSDMPEKYWDQVVRVAQDAARAYPSNNPGKLHIIVWISSAS